MLSEDGKNYTDLPSNAIIKVRFIGADGQWIELDTKPRNDSKPFAKGQLGYNVPGSIEWDGLTITVGCNLFVKGSAAPERVRTAAANKKLADRARVRSQLTSLGLSVAKRERIEELMFDEHAPMQFEEALQTATAEAVEYHVPRKEQHTAPKA